MLAVASPAEAEEPCGGDWQKDYRVDSGMDSMFEADTQPSPLFTFGEFYPFLWAIVNSISINKK